MFVEGGVPLIGCADKAGVSPEKNMFALVCFFAFVYLVSVFVAFEGSMGMEPSISIQVSAKNVKTKR